MGGSDNSENILMQVLVCIKKNRIVSREELSRKLGVPVSQLACMLEDLERLGYLGRKGKPVCRKCSACSRSSKEPGFWFLTERAFSLLSRAG
jgi:hypothetical protein